MADAEIRGIRLYYEERGAGEPILLIHGTSSSALIWGTAVDQLSQLGRVIAYDRRGCTRSQRPEPYLTTSVAEHTDDAAALLEALDASPAIVIGRSYGGAIAIDLALRYPDRVRALVLLEAGMVGLSADADRWLEKVNERVRVAATRDMASVAEVFIRSLLGDAAWHEMPEALKAMFMDNGPAIVAEMNGGDLRLATTELARIGQPTLVVGAADSPQAFRDMTDRIAGAIPDSRRALVEGGHLVNPAHPEVFRFLQEITAHQE